MKHNDIPLLELGDAFQTVDRHLEEDEEAQTGRDEGSEDFVAEDVAEE